MDVPTKHNKETRKKPLHLLLTSVLLEELQLRNFSVDQLVLDNMYLVCWSWNEQVINEPTRINVSLGTFRYLIYI